MFPGEDLNSIQIDWIVHSVHDSFSQHTRKKSLIIFDNATPEFVSSKLKGNLPRNTDVIFTSKERDHYWELKIDLSEEKELQLTESEGIDILENWIGSQAFDRKEAQRIVRRFYNLPLLIAQAGNTISTSLIPISAYLLEFNSKRKELCELGKVKSANDDGYIDTYTSVIVTIESLIKQDPRAFELIQWCAFLPSKQIPKNLLLELSEDQMTLSRLLKMCRSLTVFDQNGVTLHDEIAGIIIDISETSKDKILSSLSLVSEKYSEFLLSDPKKAISIYEKALWIEDQKTLRDPKRKASLLFNLGKGLAALAKWEDSIVTFRRFLDLGESSGFKDTIFEAEVYHLLAWSYRRSFKGREFYLAAKESREKAKEILYKLRQNASTPKVESLCIAVEHALGGDFIVLGKNHNDKSLIKEGIKYLKSSYQKSLDPYWQARNLDGLAWGYNLLGKDSKSIEKSEEAVRVLRRATKGENSPGLALALVNLATKLSENSNRQSEASKLAQEGVVMYVDCYGNNSPFLIDVFIKEGTVLKNLQKYNESAKCLLKAINIYLLHYGESKSDSLLLCFDKLSRNISHLDDETTLKIKNEAYELCKKLYPNHRLLGEIDKKI